MTSRPDGARTGGLQGGAAEGDDAVHVDVLIPGGGEAAGVEGGGDDGLRTQAKVRVEVPVPRVHAVRLTPLASVTPVTVSKKWMSVFAWRVMVPLVTAPNALGSM